MKIPLKEVKDWQHVAVKGANNQAIEPGFPGYDSIITGIVLHADPEKDQIVIASDGISKKAVCLFGRGMEIMPIPEPKQLTAELRSTETPIPIAPWVIGKHYTIVRPNEQWTAKLVAAGLIDLMFDSGPGKRRTIIPRCGFMHAFEEIESVVEAFKAAMPKEPVAKTFEEEELKAAISGVPVQPKSAEVQAYDDAMKAMTENAQKAKAIAARGDSQHPEK